MDQDVELLTGQMVNLLNSAKPWNTVVRADKIASRYRRWREQAEKANPWYVVLRLAHGRAQATHTTHDTQYTLPGSAAFTTRLCPTSRTW
jgi:hypothetical protein